MIRIDGREIADTKIGGKGVLKILVGPKLLWQALRNSILGGWWQGGHCWQYGCGWKQNSKNS